MGKLPTETAAKLSRGPGIGKDKEKSKEVRRNVGIFKKNLWLRHNYSFWNSIIIILLIIFL